MSSDLSGIKMMAERLKSGPIGQTAIQRPHGSQSGRSGGRARPLEPTHPHPIYREHLEVHLFPEKEARVRKLAIQIGKEAPEVVEATVDRMLESTRSFSIPLKRGGLADPGPMDLDSRGRPRRQR